VELCRTYGAVPVVDDSHALGVLGENGRGILEEKGIADFEGVYTASLGKALANLGGVVAGKKILIEALRYSCPGLIYSTALPPANAAGVLQALRIIRGEFGRLRSACQSNHALLLSALRANGFEARSDEAPIATLAGGTAENTIALAREFFHRRILTTPFVPPSVPEGKGVLRLIIGAKLNLLGMSELVQALNCPDAPAWPEAEPVERKG
jgi:7-keto-8-aminopelargonate synthetase-like enzyme